MVEKEGVPREPIFWKQTRGKEERQIEQRDTISIRD
jgi:hypothetical protein